MFTDPQSVTISGTAVSLPRTAAGTNQGGFASNDGLVTMKVADSYGSKIRRTLELGHSKIAADPFLTGVNNKYSMRAYLVVETPQVGYTVAEAKAVVDALVAYLTASTGARVTQLLGGEI